MNTHKLTSLTAILILAASVAVLCYRSPRDAANMEVVPDSVEYCAGAYNIVADGKYAVEIQNEWYPPRYSPWFSSLFIMPAYILAPLSMGAPIIVILLCSLAAVLLAFKIGNRISGRAGGVFSASFLLLLPVFRASAMSIMTDVPCTALCLAAAAVYVCTDKSSPTRRWLMAGLVCALSSSIRPLTIFIALPFLVFLIRHRPRRATAKALALLAPSALMGSLTLLYNDMVFGNAFRTGYSYWCAVPYDYPSLTFGLKFASRNAATLLLACKVALPLFVILLLLYSRYRATDNGADPVMARTLRLGFFATLSLSPLLLAHLLYFYPEQRFFLPVVALIAVAAGGLAGSFLKPLSRVYQFTTLAILLMICLLIRARTTLPAYNRRNAIEQIDQLVPEKATVITALDPVYAELMLRNRNIAILPISRSVEYASKIRSPVKVDSPSPRPTDSYDHRAPAMLQNGLEAVDHTADEILESIAERIQQGNVFVIETGNITSLEYPALQRILSSFPARQITSDLYVLGPPNMPASSPAD